MSRPEAARGISIDENFANAARKLRQGIGRGIRKTDDRCAVWILDNRFPRPGQFARGPFAGMPRCALPARFFSDFGDAAYENASIFGTDGEFRPAAGLR